MATLFCLQGKGTVLGMDGIGGMGIGTVMSRSTASSVWRFYSCLYHFFASILDHGKKGLGEYDCYYTVNCNANV